MEMQTVFLSIFSSVFFMNFGNQTANKKTKNKKKKNKKKNMFMLIKSTLNLVRFKFIYLFILPGSTECTKRKGRGDCSNICTTNLEGQSCLCDYGVDINNNAKTCTNGKCWFDPS